MRNGQIFSKCACVRVCACACVSVREREWESEIERIFINTNLTRAKMKEQSCRKGTEKRKMRRKCDANVTRMWRKRDANVTQTWRKHDANVTRKQQKRKKKSVGKIFCQAIGDELPILTCQNQFRIGLKWVRNYFYIVSLPQDRNVSSQMPSVLYIFDIRPYNLGIGVLSDKNTLYSFLNCGILFFKTQIINMFCYSFPIKKMTFLPDWNTWE